RLPQLRGSRSSTAVLPATSRDRDGRGGVHVHVAAGRAHLGEEAGGFFTPEDEQRSCAAHLEAILVVLAHIASVDAFQHWIYTSGEGHDRDARDRQWLQLRERFQPGVDWSGLDELRIARWLAQPHFFTHPFYYIEYGIAQLGALQVCRNSMADQDSAVA